ncbi:MAG: hypothetical protein RLZZ436_2669 [Planctomycetota bacterium]|jgi:hypothetical protein
MIDKRTIGARIGPRSYSRHSITGVASFISRTVNAVKFNTIPAHFESSFVFRGRLPLSVSRCTGNLCCEPAKWRNAEALRSGKLTAQSCQSARNKHVRNVLLTRYDESVPDPVRISRNSCAASVHERKRAW